MSYDVWLLVLGAGIGLVSSVVGAVVQHILTLRVERKKKEWERLAEEANWLRDRQHEEKKELRHMLKEGVAIAIVNGRRIEVPIPSISEADRKTTGRTIIRRRPERNYSIRPGDTIIIEGGTLRFITRDIDQEDKNGNYFIRPTEEVVVSKDTFVDMPPRTQQES